MTTVRLAKTLDALHRRRLTRPIRAKQAEDFTLLDRKRYIVDSNDPTVGFMEVIDLNDLAHVCSTSPESCLEELLDDVGANHAAPPVEVQSVHPELPAVS